MDFPCITFAWCRRMPWPCEISRASHAHGADACCGVWIFLSRARVRTYCECGGGRCVTFALCRLMPKPWVMRMVPIYVAAFGSFCHALVFAHVANTETPPLQLTAHMFRLARALHIVVASSACCVLCGVWIFLSRAHVFWATSCQRPIT